MELHELINKAERLISHARTAVRFKHAEEAYDHLGKLYDLLDDEVGSRARDKRESTKSDKKN